MVSIKIYIKTFKYALFGLSLLFLESFSFAQSPNETMYSQTEIITEFLSNLSEKNQANLRKLNGYFEIHYVRIDRQKNNRPKLTLYQYSEKKDPYFNPASMVKLPILLMTLEKLDSLKIDKFSRYETKNKTKCNNLIESESKSLEGYYNLANDIRKILLVSDNSAYNILFDFLGQEYIDKKLKEKGYSDVKIVRRFTNCSLEENRQANPFWFYDKNGTLIYDQPLTTNASLIVLPENDILIGKAYYENNSIINDPKSFKSSNKLALKAVLTMLQSLIFPITVDVEKRWNISNENIGFVLKYLAQLPCESGYIDYQDSEKYSDNYKKLIIFGDQTLIDSNVYKNLKIFNIIGYSYGFISDVAYIVDFASGVEFFLAISMYANENDIIDGKYNYHDIARPIMGELGRVVLDYEKQRKKLVTPDFTFLKALFESN